MNPNPRLLLLAVAAMVIATAAVSLRGSAPQPPGSLVVTTADLERVFNAMNRLKDAESALEQKLKPHREQAEVLKQEAEKLKQDVDSLAPGNRKHEEAQKLLSRKVWDYRAQIDFINARLDAARGEARVALFQHILDAAAPFAQAQGIDLILADDSGLPLQSGTDLQVVQQLALRRIVYSDTAMDVTDALTKWINEH